MQIENKDLGTITKALLLYSQHLERKVERLEAKNMQLKTATTEPKTKFPSHTKVHDF